MEMTMDRNILKAMVAELAKDIKTEADLNALSAELLKLTVETALNAELTGHLGYKKHGDRKPAVAMLAMASPLKP
jgi:putative transposase